MTLLHRHFWGLLMKQFLSLCLFVCSGLIAIPSEAQWGSSCYPSRNEYDSRSQCERYHNRCEYDSYSRCYEPIQYSGSRCDQRNDQFDTRTSCERYHRNCEYSSWSQCYVPASNNSRCDYSRNQYDSSYDCERRHNECRYNSNLGCYVPDARPIPPVTPPRPVPPTRQCNSSFDEFSDINICQRIHSQGCQYRSDIMCYVPNPRPITPPTPPAPPAPAVCPWTDIDGSYEGRGRRGFPSNEICEISEGRRPGVCERRADGCYHPRGK